MICENCGNKHDGKYGSGRFCKSFCARSYSSKKEQGKTKNAICILCGKKTTIPKRAASKYAKCEQCIPQKRKNLERQKIKRRKYCLNCNKKLTNKQTKYCNIFCQHNYTYENYIERWKQGLENGLKKPNETSGYIHRYIRKKYNNKCVICGWNKVNKITGNVPVELEHIDGHWYNNEEENLILLCPNCHSLISTYGSLNIGNGRPERKIRRNKRV